MAGIVLGQYRHVVYAFPTSGCEWWGFGSVGGVPGEVWVNGALQSGGRDRTSWVTTSGSITPTPSSAGRWP